MKLYLSEQQPVDMSAEPRRGESAADAARSAASSSDSVALAALLASLFTCPSAKDAVAFAASPACTHHQRSALAYIAGLEADWVRCDQSIAANVRDLAEALVAELSEPFWFYQTSLTAANGTGAPLPRTLFEQKLASEPLRWSKKRKYWTARSGAVQRQSWLPPAADTLDAVVHFVQSGSGTGVHVGDGLVLTCAHVLDARDDVADDVRVRLPDRVGRRRVVVFASGRTFLAQCCAVEESLGGDRDVSVMVLGAELPLQVLPGCGGGIRKGARGSRVSNEMLPAANVAAAPAIIGAKLFCVGNPSNIDLESLSKGGIDFEPPTWHASVGRCEGYLAVDTAQQAAAHRDERGGARGGRALARAGAERPVLVGKKSKAEDDPVLAYDGIYVEHSCWTYWGHSGAPLFDERGRVVGLHCAWDDRTGMRHGQKLRYLKSALGAAAEESTAVEAPPQGKKRSGAKRKKSRAKRRR